jgi:hypothetical protein
VTKNQTLIKSSPMSSRLLLLLAFLVGANSLRAQSSPEVRNEVIISVNAAEAAGSSTSTALLVSGGAPVSRKRVAGSTIR